MAVLGHEGTHANSSYSNTLIQTTVSSCTFKCWSNSVHVYKCDVFDCTHSVSLMLHHALA
jgi:hypothetical protein